MIDSGNSPGLPETAAPAAQPRQGGVFVRVRRSLIVVGALAGGIALGAGGLALAETAPQNFGWMTGMRLAMAQHFIKGALDSVGATSEQEAKVHDIVAAAAPGILPDPQEHEALHKKVLELLKAPTVDRAAVEKLRSDQIAAIDAKSKRFVSAILDIADTLTPDQRAKLADELGQMIEHHRQMHGPWGFPGQMGEMRQGPMGFGPPAMGPSGPYGMDGEHGPGFGPEQGPEKD